MTVEALGDSAAILRNLPRPAYEVAEALNAANLDGLDEAVASYDTVGLYFDPRRFDPCRLPDVLPTPAAPPRTVRIPVCYERGPDLEATAEALGMSADSLATLHAEPVYRCHAIGFCPGFPYLGPLPEALAGVARRERTDSDTKF